MAADPGKTEPATPKRRRSLRRKGNVAKSQEFTKFISLAAGFVAMNFYFPFLLERLAEVWTHFFTSIETFELTSTEAYAILLLLVKELAIICGPIMLIIAFSVYVTLRKQVGPLWTFKVFKFNLQRFNILAGVKRMLFSKDAYIRLVKTIALALVVGYMPYLVLLEESRRFSDLYYTTPAGLGIYILKTGYTMILYTLVPLSAIALFDLWHSFHRYEERNKMSKQEVRDEVRNAEGDPTIKRKQKQKMMEVLMSRMMQQVPKADVVITNPTHYAVALKYDVEICPAPLVVAKGIDKVAIRIKDLARESGVPIRENRLLARSLYAEVEVGDPISEDLYKAVASIIAEIWRMKGKI